MGKEGSQEAGRVLPHSPQITSFSASVSSFDQRSTREKTLESCRFLLSQTPSEVLPPERALGSQKKNNNGFTKNPQHSPPPLPPVQRQASEGLWLAPPISGS